MNLPQASLDVAIASTDAEGSHWAIATEHPVEIGFNGRAWTVMMASPGDLEDLAFGLAVSEGVLNADARPDAIEIMTYAEGTTVDIRIAAKAINGDRLTRRTLDGHTGCGLCGIESLAELHAPGPGQRRALNISDAAIERAFNNISDRQTLNQQTHSVHAAAWCSPVGVIEFVREDVGRHNALDKLIGLLAAAGRIEAPGFVLMSSRCSYELVYKTAATGASALVTLSAPTSLALQLADAINLQILTRGPGGRVVRLGV
ncbi:formate dehydrogenase accessory sulfurtransferase FdhD [Maricaulis sp.]|uniref:formate dehydrogenase accessory sulfurtransferase FdhD n=1 Tax=Maricaulis sp. TaxID=1486257 RepID=UPI001AFD5629|nr:formate dehydrogenase accessory sulfurtransferase FdhD [Maricaulis sp.]MBO6796126.1 formate dehydrogenase accessory sulfurtransferase FdhD [Maricaulis sp.]